MSVVLRVVISGDVDGAGVVETEVVEGAVGDGDGVSGEMTCSGANVVLGEVGVLLVAVGLTLVEEVVVALVVVVVVIVVVEVVVVVVVGLVVEVVVVVAAEVGGAVVVLLDRVTYAKGVEVGGGGTPSGDDYYHKKILCSD